MTRCTGSNQSALDIRISTIPKFFGQRFGVCATCGKAVRIRKNTTQANAHSTGAKE